MLPKDFYGLWHGTHSAADTATAPTGPDPHALGLEHRGGLAKERHHRLAVLHGACPECDSGRDEQSRAAWVASYTDPLPPQWEPRPGDWLTPEGEIASCVQGQFRVFDRQAFHAWADQHFTTVGQAYAYVVNTDSGPWTRALFWFGDRPGRLYMETSSADRWFHLEVLFEHLWPPVFRGMRSLAPFDPADLTPSDELRVFPAPPAEASVYSRLRRVS